MSTQQPSPPGGFNITPGDIIYTLFRHLKKIIFFAILGIVAGACTYKFWPTVYESNAKLMIKFVAEDRGVVDSQQETRVVSYGARGTGYIISAEEAIISSLDLARSVAEKIGPENIIVDPDTTPTLQAATAMIRSNMTVFNVKYTNLINIAIKHPVAETAPKILDSIIETYFEKHIAIHRKSDAFEDFVTRETDQMRMRLQQTETEIKALLNKADVISISEAKLRIGSDISTIRHKLLETQSQIAELSSLITQTEKVSEPQNASDNERDKESDEQTNATPSPEFAAAISDYSAKRQRLELLLDRERNLSLQYKSTNSQVIAVQNQIKAEETELKKLREEFPELTLIETVERDSESGLPSNNTQSARINVVALQSRLTVLNEQLLALKTEAKRIDEIEISVNELERRKALQESKYRGLLESMEKTRVQEELGEGVNNISIVESPSPAYIASNKRLQFSAGITAGIGLIGLAWALLVDLLLDRSIKRPTEIQRNLGIPLFMSLPDLNSKRYRKMGAKSSRQTLLQAGKVKQLEASKRKENYKPKSPTLQAAALSQPKDYGINNGDGPHEIAPWDERHALNEHFDALRDKVITYFESKNLNHKPKLIAMTGVGQHSGVTTIASGLAGSLSKIGEGSVLLVDMTLGQETAQQFYQGKNIMNLDEVLDSSEEAKIGNNLYVVAEGSNGMKIPRILPQRFNKIMPKLRASDFDYIIFDMPPVSAISSTPRLASFMDVVLMVMDSEKTNRDVANQALELLADSKAHLGGILNKTKSHVPKKLEQDLLSQA